MRYQLQNGNTIIADEAFMLAHYPQGGYTLMPDNPTATEALNAWWMTKLSFRNRFTANEKAAIEYAAAQNTLAAAGLRASLADQRDASYIDLKRANTIAGVQALEAATLLAAGRAAEILTTPVPEADRFHG